MKNAVKREIRKAVKRTGSHLEAVKHVISIQFPSVDFADFEEYTKNEILKKFKNA